MGDSADAAAAQWADATPAAGDEEGGALLARAGSGGGQVRSLTQAMTARGAHMA
jgi:hypothetical protein